MLTNNELWTMKYNMRIKRGIYNEQFLMYANFNLCQTYLPKYFHNTMEKHQLREVYVWFPICNVQCCLLVFISQNALHDFNYDKQNDATVISRNKDLLVPV